MFEDKPVDHIIKYYGTRLTNKERPNSIIQNAIIITKETLESEDKLYSLGLFEET